MEVKVLEEDKKLINVEIIGEDHTLADALRQELWNEADVTISGYNIEHPLVSNPVLTVETSGKKEARKALFDAVDRLKKKNNEILQKIQKI
ncbi:MAG: DNA-directed RNA polymerase subunit L [Candidatus Woesearchaeota archaeon]